MKHSFFLLFLLAWTTLSAQEFTINGNIKDASTGEDLIGATMLVKELPGTGAMTNSYGFYSLTLPKGSYTLRITYIGYETQEIPLELNADERLDVKLQGEGVQVETVDITAKSETEHLSSTEMGTEELDLKQIEKVPVIFGEKDILKTILLFPGVKTGGEGNGGFFVRGGSNDQNLILLDEAPVYNPSHLLGFFSVFNSDALKDVKLYKAAIPAEYGGRLASVMDIKMKEGNNQKFSGSGGLGLISSRLTLEAPIVKDKGSVIVSGRRSYADLFTAFSSDENIQNTTLYFYDINAKANYKIGDNDRLYLSGYFGRDRFKFSDDFGFDWGNTTGTLRWNHIYGKKLFSNTTFVYSDYDYKIDLGDNGVVISSSIRDFNLKQDFDYFLNQNNTMRFGVQAIHHTFIPGEVNTDGSGFLNSFALEDRYAVETAAYISNEQKFNVPFKLNYGLRFSSFSALGEGEFYSYNPEGAVIDTTSYGNWENVKTYTGLAPRIAGTWMVNGNSSLKASFARTYQYIHQVSSTTSTAPTDIWIPSSQNVKPQISDQYSIGWFQDFRDHEYAFSAEVYYRDMQNVIDYRTGAQVNLNPTLEGDLLTGDGRAYGVELMLRKKKGKLTGWLSYTLSRTEKSIEGINDGNWFAARQDRPHDISLVLMYDISPRINVSGSFVYYTGNAVTFPSGQYEVAGQTVNQFTERNGYRMPDYHRLDLGLTIYDKPYKYKTNDAGEQIKVSKRWRSNWNFSLYNAYGRENAYTISFEESETDPNVNQAVQLSLFRWVPSVTYNFNF